MDPSLTDTLCTRCGLCCDGTLFADVELAGAREAEGLESLGESTGVEVEDDGGAGFVLVQPCGALRGTKCSIYEHRPGCCRTFECRLLADVRRGAVTVEAALSTITGTHVAIARVTGGLAALGRRDARLPLRENVAEAIAADPAGGAGLASAMAAVETLVRTRFLG